MAKYIDKADIIKLISECMFDLSDSDDLTRMLTEVDELPSVEIIHCKDCKHYYFADNRVEAEQCHVCGYWDFDSPSPNGFCSFAEK